MMAFMTALCRFTLLLYPAEFRREFGAEIIAAFDRHYRELHRSGQKRFILAQVRDVLDLFRGALIERFTRLKRRSAEDAAQDAMDERMNGTMDKYLVIWKVYFAWQAREEAEWLQAMSRAGWEFVEYNWFVYYFRKQETPVEYEYKFERRFGLRWQNEIQEAYLTHMSKDGWEFIKYFLGWYYFRRPAAAGTAGTNSPPGIEELNLSKSAGRRAFVAAGLTLLGFGLVLGAISIRAYFGTTTVSPLRTVIEIFGSFLVGVAIGLSIVALFGLIVSFMTYRSMKRKW